MKTTGLKLSEVIAMYEEDSSIMVRPIKENEDFDFSRLTGWHLHNRLNDLWEIKPKEVLVTREKLEAIQEKYSSERLLMPYTDYVIKELGL